MFISNIRLRALIHESLAQDHDDELDADIIELIETFADISKSCKTFDDINEQGFMILKMLRRFVKHDDIEKFYKWNVKRIFYDAERLTENDITAFSIGSVFFDIAHGVSEDNNQIFAQVDALLEKLSQQLTQQKDKNEIFKLSAQIIKILREIYGINIDNASPYAVASLSLRCKSLSCYAPYTNNQFQKFVKECLLYALTGYEFELKSRIQKFLRYAY